LNSDSQAAFGNGGRFFIPFFVGDDVRRL